MAAVAGVSLISYMVQQCSHKHLSLDLLKALDSFAKSVKPSEELYQDILAKLVLNLKLFSKADFETQNHLVQQLTHISKVGICFPLRTACQTFPFI